MSYYEEKSLQEVCGGGKCLKPESIFDKVKNESPEMAEKIRKRGDLMLAKQMPGPRDLDGRVEEIKGE